MIRREEIDGRPATVAYLDDEFQPVEFEKATVLKIIYDDGEVAFARVGAEGELSEGEMDEVLESLGLTDSDVED